MCPVVSPLSRSRTAPALPTMPSNVPVPTTSPVRDPRQPPAGLSAASILQAAHLPHHQAGQLLRRERCVEDQDPVWFPFRQLLEAPLHPTPQVRAARLAPAARAGARTRLLAGSLFASSAKPRSPGRTKSAPTAAILASGAPSVAARLSRS